MEKERIMKIFNQVAPWPGKVNFIDGNNVILGYDLTQDCCEDSNWFISDNVESEMPEELNESNQSGAGFGGYYFDTEFYKEFEEGFDGGKMAVFRIVKRQRWPVACEFEKFVHIFNYHNGYYSHGFTFSKPFKTGSL